jgi:hypothetical protein
MYDLLGANHHLWGLASDRFYHRWCREYIIAGIDGLKLHHLYRARGFLGEEVENQKGETPFSPLCNKDHAEEFIFS